MDSIYNGISRRIEQLFGQAYNGVQSSFEQMINPLVKAADSFTPKEPRHEVDVPNFLLSLQKQIPHFNVPDFNAYAQRRPSINEIPTLQKYEELRRAIQRTLEKIQPKELQKPKGTAKPSMRDYARAKSAGRREPSGVSQAERRKTTQPAQSTSTNLDVILKVKENQFRLQLQQQQQQYEQQIANLQLQQQQNQTSEISRIKEGLYRAENELNAQRQQLQEQLQSYQAQAQELQFERQKIQQFKKTLLQQQKALIEQKQHLDEQQRLSVDLQQQQISQQMKQMLEEKQQFEQKFALDRVQKHNELQELEKQLIKVQNEIEQKQQQLAKIQLQEHQKQISDQYIIHNLNQCNTKSFENTFTMNTGKCLDFLGVEGIEKVDDSPSQKSFQEPRNSQQVVVPSQTSSIQPTLNQKQVSNGSAGSPHSASISNKQANIILPSQSESPEVIENTIKPQESIQKGSEQIQQYKIPLKLWPDIDKIEVPVAQWAVGRMLQQNVVKSAKLKPEEVFGQVQDAPSMKNLFGIQNHPFDSRNRVTQNWAKDRIKEGEIANYYKQMYPAAQ